MHEPAGVVENLVQILQNTPILKFRIPPPMEIYADLGTLGIFNYRIPPPMEIYADLGTLGIFNYRIPPQWKFMQILALWVFSITEYPPFSEFLITEYPPFREAHTHTHIYYAITHTYTMPSSVHCG